MARNGSGTYSLPAGNPVVTGTPISSAVQNTTMTDIANAITQSLAYDGQTVPIANIPFGGFKATGLGAATVNGDAVRYEQWISTGYPTSLVRRLVGNVNSGTPLTKYDLSADIVVLQNSTTGTVTRTATGTLTCDLGLAGSAANGRDQLAAFSINSWIYLYFIWNGTTLATLASTTVPASFTGSTLPSGYTHWAFATAIRWNASSNIIPMRTQGSSTWYDLSDGGVNRVLNVGQATVMTAVNLSSLVPPIAPRVTMLHLLTITHSAGAEFLLQIRPTGSASSGQYIADLLTPVAGGVAATRGYGTYFLGTSTQIDYKINSVPSGSGGAVLDVFGFTVPNGDA